MIVVVIRLRIPCCDDRYILALSLDTKKWWNDGTVEKDKYIEDINYNEMPFAWTQYYPSIATGTAARQEYCSLGYKSLVHTEIRIFKDPVIKSIEHSAG